ncbi:hypothetical protein C1H46_035990 [Malus baccata]|uniref:Uncharacterized protein n=1 Tax=Malus baccata TaxID=106549 RepID=A0A540KWB0_MALBA|nr:hypothetical protein C1H46_035990 [Malus baccata]
MSKFFVQNVVVGGKITRYYYPVYMESRMVVAKGSSKDFPTAEDECVHDHFIRTDREEDELDLEEDGLDLEGVKFDNVAGAFYCLEHASWSSNVVNYNEILVSLDKYHGR